MHMIVQITMDRKETDMKKKKASRQPKQSKSRRPLYYVDNPNKLELQWLDDIKKPDEKPDEKPITVHGAVPVEVWAQEQVDNRLSVVKARLANRRNTNVMPIELHRLTEPIELHRLTEPTEFSPASEYV